jgi:adenylate cyclase
VSEAGEEESAVLSRYVPDAILDCIRRGTDVTCGTREVTVLFVDLHGFTGFSEPLGAEEVFRVLSEYAHCASSIVRKHGGTVVEFNGDGMMAVFGAPQELPHKERSGVAAAREIAREMLSRWTLPQGPSPPVGVGVATGEAYVGNIQSADRLIWSAVGNTTNLASRLQQLTHELRTPVVIDAATWRGAGASAGDFERRPGTAIRGRRMSLDVFTLPPDQPC